MRISRSIHLLLVAVMMLGITAISSAGIILQIGIAPPPLPVYTQPACPGEGYIWTPGYWAYGDDGYFWVPGTWVLAPEPGFLWTPGYWGWEGGIFNWHAGYWGPTVGFYGGINYGFGYTGVGFAGGRWEGGHFFYNREVTNVNVTVIHNVYRTTVVNNVTTRHVAFNGPGGITARPTPAEEAAAHERHIEPVAVQTQHVEMASKDRRLYENVNHGKPAIAATAKPNEFKGHGVVAAKAAAPSYKPVAERRAEPVGGRKGAPPPAAHNVPRPENKAPANEHANNVPRPGNAEHGNAPRPENKAPANEHANNVPRPGNAEHGNAPRPENKAPANEHANNVPRPGSTEHAAHPAPSRAENAPKPSASRESTPRETAPHAQAHHESAPREAAPHAEAPRESAPKPEHNAPKPEEKHGGER